MNSKGRCYYHLFQVPTHDELSGGWRYLLHDHLCKMEASGLGAAFGCDVVMVGDAQQRAHITGKDWLSQYGFPTLREEWDISENEGFWENRTIQLLWKDAVEHHTDPDAEPYCALYAHTKGSLTENYCVHLWREYMQAFLIEDWKRCVECLVLEGWDTCGVDYRPYGGFHYSGNFWWARSDFIASLPDPQDRSLWKGEPRMWSEYYLCHRGGRHLPLWDSGHADLYRSPVFRRDYVRGLKKPLP